MKEIGVFITPRVYSIRREKGRKEENRVRPGFLGISREGLMGTPSGTLEGRGGGQRGREATYLEGGLLDHVADHALLVVRGLGTCQFEAPV